MAAEGLRREIYDEGTLKRVARFCWSLQRADRPRKDVIDDLKMLAERAGADEVIAGAVTRHIKFASGPKLLLCWYLLDILAKNHPESFGISFGPQILDLAVEHMNWSDPKDEQRYLRLVETWRVLFGDMTCEDILRRKEGRKADLQAAEQEMKVRQARGEVVPSDPTKLLDEKPAKVDEMSLILGGTRDGQVVEYNAPCKYYLMGICENPNCSKPHPKGMFGTVDAKKVFADWKCLRCGYENPASKKQCWRRDCVGTRPDELYVARQVQENPFRDQFGYDPTNESEAVEWFKKKYPFGASQWVAERRSHYFRIWEIWSRSTPNVAAAREYLQGGDAGGGAAQAPPAKVQVRACTGCGAPLRPDAVFCTQCGQQQPGQQQPQPGQQPTTFQAL
eukprot:Hpha_TRINITY_DN3897_c0_g1::TRINITY_DN3897_c0_g1_i1::g.44510::m.44510